MFMKYVSQSYTTKSFCLDHHLMKMQDSVSCYENKLNLHKVKVEWVLQFIFWVFQLQFSFRYKAQNPKALTNMEAQQTCAIW